MLDGWIWADEETLSSPMAFAWDDDGDEGGWETSLDWEDEDDDLDEEWDDDDDEDEEWEEWEAKFEEEEEDEFGRRRSGRPDWN